MSLRTTSTRKLVTAGAIAAVVAVGGGVAIARGSGGGPTPPPQPLANAVHDALTAQHPAGITARIRFGDSLVPGSASLGTDSPLLSGASGRLWVGDGRARLELQTENGDTEIGVDNGAVTVYDVASGTAYHASLPTRDTAGQTDTGTHTTPSLDQISAAIARLAQHADVSGATPVDIAGQPAYQVRISPSHSGGLLGAAELAWDATNGVPLRVAVYAAGTADPVLELTATDISFGPVSAADTAVNVPSTAKTVELQAPADAGTGTQGDAHQAPVEGLAAVQAKVGFPIAAPDTLLQMPRKAVRLVQAGSKPGALVVYGQGLGAILVYERAAGAEPTGKQAADSPLQSLPSVSINGATGHELATALGTGIGVDRGGVSYLIAGSVPAAAAEAAARELLP